MTRHPIATLAFAAAIPIAVVLALVMQSGTATLLAIVGVLFVLMMPLIYLRSRDRGDRFM